MYYISKPINVDEFLSIINKVLIMSEVIEITGRHVYYLNRYIIPTLFGNPFYYLKYPDY
jgi:hypothetical protein